MWVPQWVAVVQIENFFTGDRTPYSFSVSTFLFIFISSFIFPSHFLIFIALFTSSPPHMCGYYCQKVS